MQVTQLSISNFRGIKQSKIIFPIASRVLCLIGAGDSTKSTVLDSISWSLWPSWTLQVKDSDFYNCNILNQIIIEITITDSPDKLISEDKFGLFLRRLYIGNDGNDEPISQEPICLTVRLTITSELEPIWEVVCNRHDPRPISHKDRQLLAVGVVGNDCEKDLLWTKYSVLQKYADSAGVIKDVFIAAMREAASKADLSKLDEIAKTVVTTGHKYGVNLNEDIKSKLLNGGLSYSTSVALFDGESPLNQRGMGSQRLLSIGLNIGASKDGTILLVDEVEVGLEPYRIINLIKELRSGHVSTGQVIMTTHSPVVVAELNTSEIVVLHSKEGNTTAKSLFHEGELNKKLQSNIRKNPHAFLSKRIIVCEGKTEIGFVRALDSYISNNVNSNLAYHDTAVAFGDGSSSLEVAQVLTLCGYEVCLFLDSDVRNEKTRVDAMRIIYGIPVFTWDEGNSIEEQIFSDVPAKVAGELLGIPLIEKSKQSLTTKLANLSIIISDETVEVKISNRDDLKKIGTIAKADSCAWYKRIDLGEKLGDAIFQHWEEVNENSTLKKVVSELIKWVKKDDGSRA